MNSIALNPAAAPLRAPHDMPFANTGSLVLALFQQVRERLLVEVQACLVLRE